MRDFQVVMMVLAAMLSLVPVVELYRQKQNHRFQHLSVMMTLVFVWSLNMLIKYLISDLVIAYYLHLMVYPMIFLLTYYLLKTIYAYTKQAAPKWLHPVVVIVFLIHLSITFSNDLHRLMLPFTSAEVTSQSQLMDSYAAPLFIVHMLISYVLVLYSVIKFLIYYRNIPYKQEYKLPFIFFTLTILIALLLNVIHVYIFAFYIDPTYFSVVIFTFGLYHFIYRRDFYYALLQQGRKDVLDSMREVYILTDNNGTIIDASKPLKDDYDILETRHIQAAMRVLNAQVILYEDIDAVDDKHQNKPYYYTVRKTLKLDRFDVEGHLYLFYDETKFVQLIAELETTKNYDVMTGIYNRNFLENSIELLENEYPSFGVIILDINGLKFFNDHFGHRKGDELIKRFVDKMIATTDDEHWLIRSGGDEFMIIVKEADEQILSSLENAILNQCQDDDPLKEISIAIGHKVREHAEMKFETVFKEADQALYRMKDKTSADYKARLKNWINNQ